MLTAQLQHYLGSQDRSIQVLEGNDIMVLNDDNQEVILDLSPLRLELQDVTAMAFFSDITDASSLIHAYHEAKKSLPFEEDDALASSRVSSYAHHYMMHALERAQNLTTHQCQLISDFVKNLDIYTAVRCCETFFANHANLTLLSVAKEQMWTPLFDHLAIRTGSKSNNSAQYIADYLIEHHGYAYAPIEGQRFYEFDEWSAYILYKQLKNGMLLRLFIDQSDSDTQIIQHWNHAYGYTAHHLGIRCVEAHKKGVHALCILDVAQRLHQKDITTMEPTGLYTQGMLEQLFTQPQRDEALPLSLKENFDRYDTNLFDVIKNAKLLELVARRELPHDFKELYFKDLGLQFEETNPLHSAVFYNFFLPAQAAHVIKTSGQTEK